MLLRAQLEDTDELKELAHWWTDFQEVSNEARLQMIKGVKLPQGSKRRTPKKRRKPAPKPTES